MSPAILGYLLVSLLGIGAVFLALRRFGHAGEREVSEAEASMLADERGVVSGAPRRAQNAWLFPAEGGLVVVRSLGRHPVGTFLRACDVRRVEDGPGGAGLRLRLRRFDEPSVTLRTDDPDALRRWLREQGIADDRAA